MDNLKAISRPPKKLRKIQHHLQAEINAVISELIVNSKEQYDIGEIKGYVSDLARGYSYSNGRQFTVPLWAYDYKEDGYFTYYVAHELSHQLSYNHSLKGVHDFIFYEIFMNVCPKELQHFELDFRPSASKYGISKKS